MPSPPKSEPTHTNGDDEEKERRDWEAIRRLPIYEKVATLSDRSLDVFQQIGGIQRSAADAKVAAARAEQAANRAAESARVAVEILSKAYPAHAASVPTIPPPPLGQSRRRLESLTTIADDDGDTIRVLKGQMAAAAAVEAWKTNRMRGLIAVLGLIIALAAVAGIIWAIFVFAVGRAH